MRALFIRLLELYGISGYKLTLEIQKLAYFLQEAGETKKIALCLMCNSKLP